MTREPAGIATRIDGTGAAIEDGTSPIGDALREALVGTWRLRSWESLAEDGSVDLPFGEAPVGIVVYTPDAVMITTIGQRDRPPIGDGDPLAGPTDARLAAMGTFIAYGGTFRVEGRDVIHAVEMSLFPDWAGSEQRRHVRLIEDGRVMELSTDPLPVRGRTARHRLTWARVG